MIVKLKPFLLHHVSHGSGMEFKEMNEQNQTKTETAQGYVNRLHFFLQIYETEKFVVIPSIY